MLKWIGCPADDPFWAVIFRTAKGMNIAQKWISVQTGHQRASAL
jgi:hypothetical protein